MFFKKTFQNLFLITKYRYNDNILKFSVFSEQLKNQLSNSQILAKQDSFVNDTFTGYIPIKSLDISYCSSSGPGGQNVNRVNTKVTVKLHLPTANWIPDKVKNKIAELHTNSISKDGYWLIRSDKTRQQMLNVADCMDKLRCYIAEAAKPPNIEPSFETLEKIRKQREKAAIQRLEKKKHRSIFKAQKRMEF